VLEGPIVASRKVAMIPCQDPNIQERATSILGIECITHLKAPADRGTAVGVVDSLRALEHSGVANVLP
jgi:hypothetical protein